MKKYFKILIFVTFFSILLFGFVAWLRIQEEYKYKQKGFLLIKKVEGYKNKKNRLPIDLEELGEEEPMNQGAYYEKIDSINYKIYFNIGFDNSFVYYSKSKQWRDEY